MNKGLNRADPRSRALRDLQAKLAGVEGIASRSTCVFISHKREDTDASERIAHYLLDAGVDVYFDKYDTGLAAAAASGDSNAITGRLQDGIKSSTHMICVVSPETVKSYWVPFEVGYGYGRLKLGVVTLQGIPDAALPDYMKTTEVIRGISSLNDFIAKLLQSKTWILEKEGTLKRHAMDGHPLERILDWSR